MVHSRSDVERGNVRRRRVLVVSHEATRTGAPRVAIELLRAFRSRGWDTTAVLRSTGPLHPEFVLAADRVVIEPLPRVRAFLKRWRAAKRRMPALDRRIAGRIIDGTRPDLVWCNTVISAPYAVAAADRGVRSVVHGHEQEDVTRRLVDRTGLRDELGAGFAAPVIVGCSPDTSELLARVLGVDPGEVGTVCSPIDVEAVREVVPQVELPDPDRPLVVACGTADARKGADVFVAAAEASAGRGTDASWVWVGRNEEEHASPHVRFVGERADSRSWIAAASVFVLPSRADAFPLVVLEAMALGRPIVTSDLPGPAEQVGDAGVLVPADDGAALVDAVEGLLADADRASRLGRAASQRCEELWDVGPFAERVSEIADERVPS